MNTRRMLEKTSKFVVTAVVYESNEPKLNKINGL